MASEEFHRGGFEVGQGGVGLMILLGEDAKPCIVRCKIIGLTTKS